MQAIRRSTLIEEVGEILVPGSTLADGTKRALVEVVLPESMCMSGVGWICWASGPPAISREGRICSAV